MRKLLTYVLLSLFFVSAASAQTMSFNDPLFSPGKTFAPVVMSNTGRVGKKATKKKVDTSKTYTHTIIEESFPEPLVDEPTDESFLEYDLTYTEDTIVIKTTLGRIIELSILEEEGTMWNFDYDDSMITYVQDEKYGEDLSLFFYASNYGETEIFLDSVATDEGDLIRRIIVKVENIEETE